MRPIPIPPSNLCVWCRNEFDARQLCGVEDRGVELFARLCPGCYFCLKHGSPHADPFTVEQKQLKQFTAGFFEDIRRFPHPGVA